MEDKLFEKIINEINTDRHKSISKYYPYFKIVESIEMGKYKEYCAKTITMALIAFFVEAGQVNNKKLKFEDIECFLSRLIRERYSRDMTREESVALTNYMLLKLGNEGSKFQYEYYNYFTKNRVTEYVSYIYTEGDAVGSDRFSYSLTTAGVEFYLSTKEYMDESKISAYLIILQKQLENGNLSGVKNRIMQINSETQKQIDYNSELLEKLVFGEDDAFEEYKIHKDKILRNLKEEQEIFNATLDQIIKVKKDYLSKITNHELRKKNLNCEDVLKEIEIELRRSVEKHSKLLRETLKMSSEIDKIRSERIGRLFEETFNFNKNVKKVMKLGKIENLKYLIYPLFNLKSRKQINILKMNDLFEYERKIDKKEIVVELNDESSEDVYNLDDEAEDNIKDNYMFYMKNLLVIAKDKGVLDLHEYVNYVRDTHGDLVVDNFDFINFVYSLVLNSKDSGGFSYGRLKNEMQRSEIEDMFVEVVDLLNLVGYMEKRYIYVNIKNSVKDRVYVGENKYITNIEIGVSDNE